MISTDLVLANEPILRLSAFVGIFVLIALWELAAPRRQLRLSRAKRWRGNISLAVLNTVLLRLVFPLAGVGIAIFATERGWGLLNHVALPDWAIIVVAVVVLDFAIWLQHVIFHAVPLLWRLHRVHHADLDYDLTTGARFHPLEILLSMMIKMALIVALGAPPVAVLLFEVLLNACAMFNHGNIRLPGTADRWLRLIIVTPDMHRVHHSVEYHESNANFGFNLPWWDKLFGTYRAQPDAGHEAMQIGLREFQRPDETAQLTGMLKIPFAGNAPSTHKR